MIATFAPLPPPISMPSHPVPGAVSKFPGWTPSPNNAPNAPTVKPFPITPGEIWDAAPGKTRVVVWQVENPRSPFWRGAVKLGLRHKVNGRTLEVKTTQEELALLLIWRWEDRLPERK